MSFSQILSILINAFITRDAAFAVTVGKQHYEVTIVAGTVPHGMEWFQVFQVVATILAGQTGTFQSGIFSVTIGLLAPTSAAAPAIAPKV